MKNLTITTDRIFKIDKKNVHFFTGKLKDSLQFLLNEVNINFVTNNQILEINKTYLQHNYYTDIITFNYSGDIKNLEGEIFISVDEAFENSKKFGCSLNEELLRLITHGFLHLVGYDDQNASDKKKMKKIENLLVTELSENLQKRVIINGI